MWILENRIRTLFNDPVPLYLDPDFNDMSISRQNLVISRHFLYQPGMAHSTGFQ